MKNVVINVVLVLYLPLTVVFVLIQQEQITPLVLVNLGITILEKMLAVLVILKNV